MLHVIILAAGKGTRMRSALPKVLHNIAGQSMISHVVHRAQTLSPESITVVLGHGANQVQSALSSFSNISYAIQHEQLGTGHAVACAMDSLSSYAETDRVLILYGDVPCIQVDTLQFLSYPSEKSDFILLTQHVDDPTGYGRIVRDQGIVQGIVEHKDATDTERAIQEVNTGIMSLSLGDLRQYVARLNNHNAQGEYYLTDIVSMAVNAQTRIQTVNPMLDWEVLGVNNRLQQSQLERIYQRYLAEQLMLNGVNLLDPDRIDIRGQLSCEEDVVIDVGCVFEGHVHLAKGVHVSPYCIIKNAQIGVGTKIHPFTHIEGAQIAETTSIGPFARLRSGTHIQSKAKVGNFVELKKTNLGQGSKASHLTYLGDADIAEDVNIGAGVITCNYDGVNKFKTTIEKDVFVGSDVMLVAPVTLKQGCTVGAGTVVTKDVPSGVLALGRVRDQWITGWERPKKKSS